MIDLKKILTTELGKKNGVYSIFNKITKTYYFGSNADKRGFRSRWNNHLIELRNNKHMNTHLQKAWNKYGEDSFEFRIRVICKPELCLILEQKYLDICLRAKEDYKIFRKSGYNLSPKAGNCLGVKRTEKQIIANRLIQKGKEIIAINEKLEVVHSTISIRDMARITGFKRTNINKVVKGEMRTYFNLVFTYKDNLQNKIEEIKNNPNYFSKTTKGKPKIYSYKPVKSIDLKTGEIINHESLKAAGIFAGVGSNSVWRNLKGQRTSEKYKFEYL